MERAWVEQTQPQQEPTIEELTARIAALEQQVATLRQERDAWQRSATTALAEQIQLRQTIAALEERVLALQTLRYRPSIASFGLENPPNHN